MPRGQRATSPWTAEGSRARLMRQPSTGVHGVSDMAMLSSLLNISDSVPPIQARSATTSHFFQRDLGAKTKKKASFAFQHLRTKNEASQLSQREPAQTLPPAFTHFLEASLWILRRSCRETQPSSVLSTGRCSSLTSHSPSSDSRYLGAVSPPSFLWRCLLRAQPRAPVFTGTWLTPVPARSTSGGETG